MLITDFSQLDLSRRYSYADYLTWAFKERVEIIRGKVLRMSPAPGRKHQKIATNLSGLAWLHFRKKDCQVFEAPFDVRLPVPKGEQPYTVVQPDLSVICDPEKLDDRGCNGAPDLVVEILSPGNAEREMKDKYGVYEAAGVREYWIVDPEHESVSAFVRNESGIYQGLAPKVKGEIIASNIFPDMKIDLGEVFDE